MNLFSHDNALALASHEGVRAAYDKRLKEARQGLDHWRESTDAHFAAVRRSVEIDQDLAPARDVANHLLKNTTDIVLLGIGGSSLGAQALAQVAFWRTAAYVPREGLPRLHVCDNLDGATFAKVLKGLDLRTTRFHVVSKSGATTEPLMQMLAAIDALEAAGGGKYLKQHFAGVTEAQSNPLRTLLNDIGAPTLDHDPDLDGRYSVFSVVGLLPALLVGLDPLAIRHAGRATFDAAFEGSLIAPIEGAALSAAARDAGLSQTVLWCYSDRLERFAKWWRQLWAESLGKGGQGTTPIDALGPLDQHSQLQLYLDGPNDKLFTLIDAASDADARAGANWATRHNLALYAGRGLNDVVAAQVKATGQTLAAHGRPVRRITLARPLDEQGIGALMMHTILETLITARLWRVDPFGQPAVEEGKVLTRQYLGARA